MSARFPLFILLLFLPAAARAAEPSTIVCFGDSLTAGYGLDDASTEAWPALVQKKISAAGLPWRVTNAGLSGETTAGGMRRVDWVLRAPVEVFILALGGNDGLRGIEPAAAKENLRRILARVRAKNPAARLVVAGMLMPSNMGADYAREFAAIFPAIAAKEKCALVPFLLDGVAGRAELNQPDGIHPTAAGHTVVAENIWQVLAPLLSHP